MSRIRGKNTKPELAIRSILHRAGFRFRLHGNLPGRPDIVMTRFRLAIFVHGCFWHCHAHCSDSSMPSTRKRFWKQKLHGNAVRDQRNMELLIRNGWRVLVIWECTVRRTTIDVPGLSARLASFVRSSRRRGEIAATSRNRFPAKKRRDNRRQLSR
jgi:DNA mismatch endonuclease (patch repair protein)